MFFLKLFAAVCFALLTHSLTFTSHGTQARQKQLNFFFFRRERERWGSGGTSACRAPRAPPRSSGAAGAGTPNTSTKRVAVSAVVAVAAMVGLATHSRGVSEWLHEPTGCHQLVYLAMLRTRVVTHSRVSDWLHGPHGCRQLDVF
jgi:hypothetical protein